MGVLWKDGEWIVEGAAPNGLQLVNDTWKGRGGEEAPECFGIMWNGLGPEGSDDCKSGCDFAPVCLELTAKQALGAAQIRLGEGHSLESLAEEMVIPESTVLALMAYSKGGANPLATRPVKKAPPPPDPQPEEVKTPPNLDTPEVAVLDTKKAEGGGCPPREKQMAARKKKAKAPVEQPEKKAQGPQKAQSAKRAKAGAKVKAVASAKPAKARGASTPTQKHWGEKTFEDRHERERKRSALIRLLKPGMVLKTTYKKRVCEVTVINGGYKVQGQVVPTLYMATLPFVGTEQRPRQAQEGKRPPGTRYVSDYSAAKFWRLKALFGSKTKPTSKGKIKVPAKLKSKLGKMTKSQRGMVAAHVRDLVAPKEPAQVPPPVSSEPVLPAPASEDPPPLPPEVSPVS